MTSAPVSPPETSASKQEEARKKTREELLKLLVMAVPAFVVQQLMVLVSSLVSPQPWRGAVVLIPFLVIIAGACRWLYRSEGWLLLSKRSLLLFCAYCLTFSLAAGTELLTWKRSLLGYAEQAPRSLFGLARLGDWHYWFLPPAPETRDLVVVTLPTADRTREAVRADLFRLLQLGMAEARGLALDFQMDAETQVDSLLSHSICNALMDIPVLVGHGQEPGQDGQAVRRQLLAEGLRECLPDERQGHVAGHLDLDGRVRMIPLYFKGDPRLPALSLRAAKLLAASPREMALPEDGLLQFVPPREGIVTLAYQGVDADEDFWNDLRDSFVFVGSSSNLDRRATPFGPVPGVLLHAWATHGLRTGHWVRRVAPGWTFPGIYLVCYLIVVAWKRRPGEYRPLLATALVLSLVTVAAAALAALARIWIEVSYPLLAIWLLVFLLWLRDHIQKRLPGRARGIRTTGGRL